MDMFDSVKDYCRQEGLDDPVFWLIAPDRYLVPDPCIMPYSVAVHLTGNERWEGYIRKLSSLRRNS